MTVPCRPVVLALALLGFAATHAAGQARHDKPVTPPPPPAPLPEEFAPIEVRKLANGIEVAVMRETRQPVVSIGVVLDIAAAAPADKIGLGEFTKAMLAAATIHRTAEQIQNAAADLGAIVTPTVLHVPPEHLDSALALMADELLHPAFPEDALARLKAKVAAGLELDGKNLRAMASRVFKNVLYGPQHPYARQQTAAAVKALTRDDLVAFYTKYVRPPNVRFVVAGDILPDSAVAKLNMYFGRWEAGTSARVQSPAPAAPKPAIYLYDQPGSQQSVVWVGGIGPRRDTPDYAAISVLNTILGGAPDSRLNINLRDKHKYTNGAQSEFVFRPVPEPGIFVALANVKVAQTDSALIEFMRELRGIRDERPITAEEFKITHDRLTKQLRMELGAVPQRALALMDLYVNNLPLTYYDTLRTKLAAVTRDDVQAAARAHLTPDQFVVVVAGDRATIGPALRAANVGPVVVVDATGVPVGP